MTCSSASALRFRHPGLIWCATSASSPVTPNTAAALCPMTQTQNALLKSRQRGINSSSPSRVTMTRLQRALVARFGVGCWVTYFELTLRLATYAAVLCAGSRRPGTHQTSPSYSPSTDFSPPAGSPPSSQGRWLCPWREQVRAAGCPALGHSARSALWAQVRPGLRALVDLPLFPALSRRAGWVPSRQWRSGGPSARVTWFAIGPNMLFKLPWLLAHDDSPSWN